jgi:hypothetical protein
MTTFVREVDMQIEQLDGVKTEIADSALQELRRTFRGSLIVPGDDEFEAARKCGTA